MQLASSTPPAKRMLVVHYEHDNDLIIKQSFGSCRSKVTTHKLEKANHDQANLLLLSMMALLARDQTRDTTSMEGEATTGNLLDAQAVYADLLKRCSTHEWSSLPLVLCVRLLDTTTRTERIN